MAEAADVSKAPPAPSSEAGSHVVFKMPPIKKLPDQAIVDCFEEPGKMLKQDHPADCTSKSSSDGKESKKLVEEQTNQDVDSIYKPPMWSGPCTEGTYYLDIRKDGQIIGTVSLAAAGDNEEQTKSFYVFGRQGDVVLEHRSINPHHAVIQYRAVGDPHELGWYIYDLGSTHGTYLNKDTVPPFIYTPMRVGDKFKLGFSGRSYTLQKFEADPESRNRVFAEAVSRGDLLAVKSYLKMENKQFLDSVIFMDRMTPLMKAAASGQTKMVACLLLSGSNYSLRNLYGETALDIARKGECPQVEDLLLAAENDQLDMAVTKVSDNSAQGEYGKSWYDVSHDDDSDTDVLDLVKDLNPDAKCRLMLSHYEHHFHPAGKYVRKERKEEVAAAKNEAKDDQRHLGSWQAESKMFPTNYLVPTKSGEGLGKDSSGIIQPVDACATTPAAEASLRVPVPLYGYEEAVATTESRKAQYEQIALEEEEEELRKALERIAYQDKRCKRCNRVGHIAAQCDRPEDMCANCRKRGHHWSDRVCSLADTYCDRCRANVGHYNWQHDEWYNGLSPAQQAEVRSATKQRKYCGGSE